MPDLIESLPSGWVFNDLVPYWNQYPPSHKVICWLAGIDTDKKELGKPNQQLIDMEAARLMSMRVNPREFVMKLDEVPPSIQALFKKYKDQPLA